MLESRLREGTAWQSLRLTAPRPRDLRGNTSKEPNPSARRAARGPEQIGIQEKEQIEQTLLSAAQRGRSCKAGPRPGTFSPKR